MFINKRKKVNFTDKTKICPFFFFKVYYYNYEMEDYSIAMMPTLLDIVKVVCFALSEGKVIYSDLISIEN